MHVFIHFIRMYVHVYLFLCMYLYFLNLCALLNVYPSTCTTVTHRYSLLPFWYTVFYEGYRTGLPVMRAMFLEFPNDPNVLQMDDQYMIGGDLLVKPVTEQNSHKVSVYLPETDKGFWIDLDTLLPVVTTSKSSVFEVVTVATPLEKLPVFVRPGRVLPRKMRLRRASSLMFFDPITLVVAPDFRNQAEGVLYLDDEHSLAHETASAYSMRRFLFSANKLSCSAKEDNNKGSATPYVPPNAVERVILCGQTKSPIKVVNAGGEELSFVFDPIGQTTTVKKPADKVAEDWTIEFLY